MQELSKGLTLLAKKRRKTRQRRNGCLLQTLNAMSPLSANIYRSVAASKSSFFPLYFFCNFMQTPFSAFWGPSLSSLQHLKVSEIILHQQLYHPRTFMGQLLWRNNKGLFTDGAKGNRSLCVATVSNLLHLS